MSNLIWLVPTLPLLGFLITSFFGKKLPESVINIVSPGSILASFVVSVLIFFSPLPQDSVVTLFEWITAGDLKINFAFQVDQLSNVFILLVTGVGFLIHVYSIGYMKGDDGYARFFAYLNLFVFFMLILVLASNYVLMFVGWEGVGLCSYFLIGFWFKNKEFAKAGKKAFVMNRFGDFGFILATVLIFMTFGAVDYVTVFDKASYMPSGGVMVAITLLLFLGATGKSAQLPLFTWLPDAMAGPTPVSALIHAATMVTAGVYMVVRSNILFALAPSTMMVVATIGAVTAIFAASIALKQNDIKKVLAYSTVSQLGYMFMAVGVGAFTGGIFHVLTHAFFKGLLFLGAGAVIHSLSGVQDIRKMGGLRKKLPITYITFFIATIAIAGLPPFSGFFSKDEILAHVYVENKFLWAIGFIAALLTAFYMFRLLFLVFFGEFRGTEEEEKHIHESPKVMTVPLIILAGLSIIGGFIGIPHILGTPHLLDNYLSPLFSDALAEIRPGEVSANLEWALMLAMLTGLAIVIFFAKSKYLNNKKLPEPDGVKLHPMAHILSKKYFVDEIYEYGFQKPIQWFSMQMDRFLERGIVDGLVNGLGKVVIMGGNSFRRLQTGNLGFYLFMMVISIVLIFFFTSI